MITWKSPEAERPVVQQSTLVRPVLTVVIDETSAGAIIVKAVFFELTLAKEDCHLNGLPWFKTMIMTICMMMMMMMDYAFKSTHHNQQQQQQLFKKITTFPPGENLQGKCAMNLGISVKRLSIPGGWTMMMTMNISRLYPWAANPGTISTLKRKKRRGHGRGGRPISIAAVIIGKSWPRESLLLQLRKKKVSTPPEKKKEGYFTYFTTATTEFQNSKRIVSHDTQPLLVLILQQYRSSCRMLNNPFRINPSAAGAITIQETNPGGSFGSDELAWSKGGSGNFLKRIFYHYWQSGSSQIDKSKAMACIIRGNKSILPLTNFSFHMVGESWNQRIISVCQTTRLRCQGAGWGQRLKLNRFN